MDFNEGDELVSNGKKEKHIPIEWNIDARSTKPKDNVIATFDIIIDSTKNVTV